MEGSVQHKILRKQSTDNAEGLNVALRSSRWSGGLPRAMLLAVVVSLLPVPALASERAAPKPGPIKAAVKKIASTDAPVLRSSAARGARQTTPQRDGSFFKTKTGLVALAVMAVGVGYAIYSTQEDRIKSPGKE